MPHVVWATPCLVDFMESLMCTFVDPRVRMSGGVDPCPTMIGFVIKDVPMDTTWSLAVTS